MTAAIYGGNAKLLRFMVRELHVQLSAPANWDMVTSLVSTFCECVIDNKALVFTNIALQELSTGPVADVEVVRRRFAEVVHLLHDSGVSVANIEDLWESASTCGMTSVIRALIEDGGSHNRRDALEAACRFGHTSIVRLLLDSGSVPRQGDAFLAVESGSAIMVTLLLEHMAADAHADVIHYASRGGRASIVKDLFERFPRSPSMYSAAIRGATARAGSVEVARVAFAHRPKNHQGVTGAALMSACCHGHEEIVRLLLSDKTVSPDPSILVSATDQGSSGVVRVLLQDSRVDPRHSDSLALKHACYLGHEEVVRLLLADGRADPAAEDSRVLRDAIAGSQQDIEDLLRKDGRAKESTSPLTKTPSVICIIQYS